MTENKRAKEIIITALLAAFLAILGMFKVPLMIPGAEFQLSAPFAVCIAACIGFKRYLKIGIISSFINILAGTHSVFNIMIAMTFRLVAGGILSIAGVNPVTLIVSGPLGTAAGRLVLGNILNINTWILIVGALPGMIFTSIVAVIMYPIMKRLMINIT